MVFIMGIMLVIVCAVMTVVFLKQVFQEKVEARVEELFLKPLPNDPHNREHKHARISYYLKGSECKGEILLKSKPKVGDKIKLSLHPKVPGKMAHYAPVKEIIAIALVFAVGLGMIGASYYVKQKLSSDSSRKHMRLAQQSPHVFQDPRNNQ